MFPGSLWAPNAAGLHEIVISQIWRPIRSRRAMAWLAWPPDSVILICEIWISRFQKNEHLKFHGSLFFRVIVK